MAGWQVGIDWQARHLQGLCLYEPEHGKYSLLSLVLSSPVARNDGKCCDKDDDGVCVCLYYFAGVNPATY